MSEVRGPKERQITMTKNRRYGTDLLLFILDNCKTEIRPSKLRRKTRTCSSSVTREVKRLQELELVHVRFTAKMRNTNARKLSSNPICFKQKTIIASEKGYQALEIWESLTTLLKPNHEVTLRDHLGKTEARRMTIHNWRK
jgi:hypothetical protein